MGFTEAIRSGFANYSNFQGRASRSEYWYFSLFIFICVIPLAVIDRFVIGWPVFQIIATLGTIVPNLSLLVRRLHDIGRSGWYYFIALVPLVGIFILLYWLCKPSVPQANAYGDARTLSEDPGHDPQRPAASREVWLTVTFKGSAIKLDQARSTLRIGRGRANDLVVPEMLASGDHARIECREGRFFLTDRSSNGTFVSVNRMQDVLVADKEIELEGSGLIGLGRPTGENPDLCIRFSMQRRG